MVMENIMKQIKKYVSLYGKIIQRRYTIIVFLVGFVREREISIQYRKIYQNPSPNQRQTNAQIILEKVMHQI